MMLKDYKVSLRTEESIAATTLRWRELAGINDDHRVNIIKFIERLCRTDLPYKGVPKLKIYDVHSGDIRAFVSFRPTCINVDQETWEFAKYGDPDSVYVLAHEVGHVVLHDHHAKAFADEPVRYNMFGLEDWSAEWQANQFADYFLLPSHIVAQHTSVEDLVLHCGVSRWLAERRWLRRVGVNKFGTNYIGDACSDCANFTLVQKGIRLKCDTCGATTECS